MPTWRTDEAPWQTDGAAFFNLGAGDIATPVISAAWSTDHVLVSWSTLASHFDLQRERWMGEGAPPGGT
jgi:hypothetical protein